MTAMATLPATQKGWSYSEYGQGEVLKFSDDLPVPSLGPDQVIHQNPLIDSVPLSTE